MKKINTLKKNSERTGKFVELDRKPIEFNQKTRSYWITSFNKDLIELKNVRNINARKISIKGYFIDNNLINVTEYHQNANIVRDGASSIALLLLFFFGMKILYIKKIKKT